MLCFCLAYYFKPQTQSNHKKLQHLLRSSDVKTNEEKRFVKGKKKKTFTGRGSRTIWKTQDAKYYNQNKNKRSKLRKGNNNAHYATRKRKSNLEKKKQTLFKQFLIHAQTLLHRTTMLRKVCFGFFFLLSPFRFSYCHSPHFNAQQSVSFIAEWIV